MRGLFFVAHQVVIVRFPSVYLKRDRAFLEKAIGRICRLNEAERFQRLSILCKFCPVNLFFQNNFSLGVQLLLGWEFAPAFDRLEESGKSTPIFHLQELSDVNTSPADSGQ